MRVLRAMCSKAGGRGMRRRDRRQPRYALREEGLEGRALLSTLIVQSAADSGQGSFRDTVAMAASGDVIRFTPALNGQEIILTSGEIVPKVGLTIQGPGPDKLTISGNHASS